MIHPAKKILEEVNHNGLDSHNEKRDGRKIFRYGALWPHCPVSSPCAPYS